jgi:hypothetical protein
MIRSLVHHMAVAAVVVAAHVLSPAHAAADPVFPPGSRIGLVPPPGMVASTDVNGFEDRERHALIVVSEHSAGVYAKIAQEFSLEQMRADGFVIASLEPAVVQDAQGFVVAARQTVAGVPMRKWALVVHSAELTAMVVALAPEAAQEAYPDATMRAALDTVVIRARLPVSELLGVLPYTIGDLAGFRLLQANTNGLALLTDGPEDTTRPAEQPNMVILTRPAEPPRAADQASFARRALADFTDPNRFRLIRSEPIRIGGGQGHEILGEAADGDNELTVIQWLRFGATSTLQMVGASRKQQWPAIFPRLRAIRDSIAAK